MFEVQNSLCLWDKGRICNNAVKETYFLDIQCFSSLLIAVLSPFVFSLPDRAQSTFWKLREKL